MEQQNTAPRQREPLSVSTGPGVQPADVIKIDLARLVFGLTRKAIENKIARGDWVEGRQYHRAPDGIWIDVQGVKRWVTTGRA